MQAKKELRKPAKSTVLAFLITFTVCLTLIGQTVWDRVYIEKLTMEQVINEKSLKLNEVISKLLYKTQTLAVLVVQSDGNVENFVKVAENIIDDPAILNVLIAPGGVVSDVFPLQGNEAVIGLDFFSEGAGNKEAVMAKDSGNLVFGGPFSLVQGGQALVGRLPVYIDVADGGKEFWGLVSVTLKYPQALDSVALETLHAQELAFEIWRINPDDGQKQIIAGSDYGHHSTENNNYIEKEIKLFNATWYFRIMPLSFWYEHPLTWFLCIASLCIALMVAYIVQSNHNLTVLRAQLENMVHLDPLTGIHNRRFFMETALAQIERVLRLNSDAYVVIFDLDHFKKVNDTYGHLAGDNVLINVAHRVKNLIRIYDLCARYGGEEFIMLITDVGESNIANLLERIRCNISDNPVQYLGTAIAVTASFGAARLSKAGSLGEALEQADIALYRAKDAGRNRVVFYEEWELELEQEKE